MFNESLYILGTTPLLQLFNNVHLSRLLRLDQYTHPWIRSLLRLFHLLITVQQLPLDPVLSELHDQADIFKSMTFMGLV